MEKVGIGYKGKDRRWLDGRAVCLEPYWVKLWLLLEIILMLGVTNQLASMYTTMIVDVGKFFPWYLITVRYFIFLPEITWGCSKTKLRRLSKCWTYLCKHRWSYNTLSWLRGMSRDVAVVFSVLLLCFVIPYLPLCFAPQGHRRFD